MQTHSSCRRWPSEAIALILAICALFGAFASKAEAQQTAVIANIDTTRTGAPISKYLYGGFIEHGGALMYRSLWAEMIDDRKFYFPINSKDAQPATPAPTNAMRAPLRKWRPIGPADAVVLDTAEPFVGSQSPRIELASETPHGISQSGFSLVKDKRYVGRIYLRGTAGAKVEVSLVWGRGRMTVRPYLLARLPTRIGSIRSRFKPRPMLSRALLKSPVQATGTSTSAQSRLCRGTMCKASGLTQSLCCAICMRACGVCPEGISSPTGIGTTPSATSISEPRYSTTPGMPCRPMIWAWTN